MASVCGIQSANDRVLKRSFTAATTSSSIEIERSITLGVGGSKARKSRQRSDGVAIQSSGNREYRRQSSSKMPSASGPRMYENQMPSFMSVYDMDSTVMGDSNNATSAKAPTNTHQQQRPAEQEAQPQQNTDHTSTSTTSNINSNSTQIHGHQHCESTSTQASDSTDSSPTTTISTVDSSSLSDPSPSSSPESPITLVPLSSFAGSSFGLDTFQNLKMTELNPIQSPTLNGRPMTSPSPRKFKNPKSLALNLGNLNPTAEHFQASEPSSPSFIKPPPLKPRKKPSLLSLNTSATNANVGEGLASPRLPSMLQRRGLKHSVSSPQMLITPGFGPSGGMTLGGERKGLGPSRFKESNMATNTFTIEEDENQEAPAGVQMATRIPGVTVGGDSFDRPHSGEDAKSPSYPEGPILMYEPSVHLYLEPKVEEAREFDVIINVAREVKNPFKVAEEKAQQEKDREESITYTNLTYNPKPSNSSDDIPPDTGASMFSFRTAFEVQPSSTDSSPTTPKASTESRQPEYIHVPWDHNTDVKDELWGLCETIDSRVKEGKKVLVHCQQGASRSATLIIAYGMYINPDLGATEAYARAQEKSKWVNPNMSLLFSLNDFKKVIDQKRNEKSTAVRKPAVKHRPTLSADISEPPTTPSRVRGNSTPSATARDAVIANAKETREVPASDSAVSRFSDFDFGFTSTLLDSQPRFRQESNPESDWEALMSPRVTEMTQNPLLGFGFGGASVPEVPPTPALFSPRVMEFPRSSFFPSPPPPQRMSLAVDEDPRSPPTKGEAPIIRSIDDFL